MAGNCLEVARLGILVPRQAKREHEQLTTVLFFLPFLNAQKESVRELDESAKAEVLLACARFFFAFFLCYENIARQLCYKRTATFIRAYVIT